MNALIMRSRSVSGTVLPDDKFKARWRGEYGELWNIPYRFRFYDWDYFPYSDSEAVERFYRGVDVVYNNWRKLRGTNIYLYGKRRTCKTAIVCLFLRDLVKKGFNCFYVNYGDFTYFYNGDIMLNENISVRDWMKQTHILAIDDLENGDGSYEDRSEMRLLERLLKARMDDLSVNIIVSHWDKATLEERWKSLYDILEGRTVFIESDISQINLIDDKKAP